MSRGVMAKVSKVPIDPPLAPPYFLVKLCNAIQYCRLAPFNMGLIEQPPEMFLSNYNIIKKHYVYL